MPKPERPPLALFAPSGLIEVAHQVFGKDVANIQLFRALARSERFSEIGIFANQHIDPLQTRERLIGREAIDTSVSSGQIYDQAALQRLGAVIRGNPDLADLAWARRQRGDAAYSLVGLIHTVAPPALRARFTTALFAPLQPWDAFICTSKAVKTSMEAMFAAWTDYTVERFGGRRIETPLLPIIPLGVDTRGAAANADRRDARQAKRAELGIGDDDTLVLWLGRLSFFEKAFPQPMFKAVSLAQKKAKSRIHFVMLGWFPRGEEDRKLYEQARRAYAPDVPCHMLDGNDRQLVDDLWAACDVFLSLVDNIQETFGLTPIEAMAAGRPVIASDWDGYRSTVRDGVDGYLIPTLGGPRGAGSNMLALHTFSVDTYQSYVGSVAQYTAVDIGRAAEALARLADEPDLRRRMGKAARERAKTQFEWAAVAAQYRDLVDELARIRRKHAPETAGATPAVAARGNPSVGDPFNDFAHFPTTVLGASTRIALPAGQTAAHAIAQYDLAKTVGLDVFASRWRADDADSRKLLDLLGDGGMRQVDEVLRGFPPARWGAIALAIAWMCKAGILRWTAAVPRN